MNKLGDFYSDFTRVDTDTPGGYARVAQVKTHIQGDVPGLGAFKLLRPEIAYDSGLGRFADELKLLVEITRDSNAPRSITRIYDSGFAPISLSQALHKRVEPNPELEIISTGMEVNDFLDRESELQKREPGQWLPFLVVELAPYDDSMLRQIRNQPQDDPHGLFRFPTGEVICMALQLLDIMQYLHTDMRRAYIDWKPEHVYWNGRMQQVKLIDWNVTRPLIDEGGESSNIKEDLRLFCGAVLYIGLTFMDPDDHTRPIGPRPTKEVDSPFSEIHHRYLTDNPDFYRREITLDNRIKEIVRRGLDPKRGFDSIETLRSILVEYAEEELGLTTPEITRQSEPYSHYYKALIEVHEAQQQLFQAQQHLIAAVQEKGSKLEFTRLFDAIKRALTNFPVS